MSSKIDCFKKGYIELGKANIYLHKQLLHILIRYVNDKTTALVILHDFSKLEFSLKCCQLVRIVVHTNILKPQL